jgi:signal transduction histidine kinase
MSESLHPASEPPESSGQHEHLRQLAHDMRHCLYTIRTATQVLPSLRYDEPRFREFLSMIEKNERRVADLLDDVLAQARQMTAED